MRRTLAALNPLFWPRLATGAGLILVWGLVVAGWPAALPPQAASWLTFIALLIAPGYLLGDLVTWRSDLDRLERLALAFPLGICILAVPGTVALLLHVTIVDLVWGWTIVSGLVMGAWLVRAGNAIHRSLRAQPRSTGETKPRPWAVDEIVVLLLLVAVFVALLPTLTLYKIDGDAYAVGTFTADALAGLPLNVAEPLFGTDLGPGVRMLFNQSLPMAYLWAYLSQVDPITLTAAASRAPIAAWILLAAYTLGSAAGGSRRVGLLTVSIQLLIYLAAPFVRGDNVSLFFFERTDADKFMVPMAVLPLVFALTIRYVRDGRRDVWLAAGLATLAVSTIHPLAAAMLALALAAFGGLHLLVNLRSRTARRRALAVWSLVALVMVLPLVQLVLANGEAPLAPSYPDSVESWPIDTKVVPALPFLEVPTLDLYGPLPELAELEPNDANTVTNPFLIWRFAVNAERRRLLISDLDYYVSDPSLLFEPPYLLALALLPVLLWRLRSDVAAQFAVGTTLALLFVMFNPIVTPLIGSLVMPWILWRFVWLLPYALIVALVVHRALTAVATALARRVSFEPNAFALSLAVPVIAGLLLAPAIVHNVENLHGRVGAPSSYPTPEQIFAHLEQETIDAAPVTVLADQEVSVTLPAYVAKAHVVAHREPTTSEIFPADRQDDALRRLIDQDAFFRSHYLTEEAVQILQRYDVRYVITSGGSDLDAQLRLSPWFEWLVDDASYSLYAVKRLAATTDAIRGNTAMAAGEWATAEQSYRQALARDPDDLLALWGLARIAHVRGRFDTAVATLQEATARADVPNLHYHLGRIYAEQGDEEGSIAALTRAQQAAPEISRYHVALGDACLRAGREDCAAQQYYSAAATKTLPDTASRLIAEADLWRRRDHPDRALPLYERAVERRPSDYNVFVLVNAYRDVEQYESAEERVNDFRREHPFSVDGLSMAAELAAAQGNFDVAIDLYERELRLRTLRAESPVGSHLALARTLLDAGRSDEAHAEIERALRLQPHNAAAFALRGELYSRRGEPARAVAAYRRSLELDPSQVAVSLALRDQLRYAGGSSDEIVTLLEAAVRRTPEPTLYLALGDQMQRSGDTVGAVDAYRQALNLFDPHTLSGAARQRAVVCARLATTYEALGQIEAAMNYYRAAVAADPDAAWVHVLLGDALRRRNDTTAAEAAYRAAIRQDPTGIEGTVRLADLLASQGEAAQAERLYAEAIDVGLAQVARSPQVGETRLAAQLAPATERRDPTLGSDETLIAAPGANGPPGQADEASPNDEDTTLVNDLARLFARRGETDRARRLYEAALRDAEARGAPGVVVARYYKGLGDVHAAEGNVDAAVDAYRRAIELDRWWPVVRLGLAQALLDSGEPAGALRELEQAVDVAPGSVDARLALADTLAEQGDRVRALAIYERVATTHPGDPRVLLRLARAWHAREERATAEQYYRKTTAVAPGSDEAYVGLAELSIEAGRYDEAERLLEQALSIDGRNPTIYLQLGALAQRRGNVEEAVERYRQVEALHTDDAAIMIAVVDGFLALGAYDEALASVQQVLDRDPDDSDVWLRLGRIRRTMGDYDTAEAALAQAQRLSPEDDRVHAELARLALGRGRLDAAQTHYEAAVERRPGETAYYLALSRIAVDLARPERAASVLEKGVRSASQPVRLYAALSSLYLQQAEPAQALYVLEQGVRAVGEEPDLSLALGAYYEARAEVDQAQTKFERALALHPEAAAVHVAMGDFSLRHDRHDAALEHYDAALQLAPANAEHHLSRGAALAQLDRTDAAIAAHTAAVALAPTSADAYLQLAALYEETEQWEQARSTYEDGRAAAPTSGELLVQYAAFLLERGEEVDALALLEEADEVAPTAATLVARARVYHELDRTDAAERDLQTALEQAPGDVEAVLAIGDLYRDRDEIDAAREAYERAVSLRPGEAAGYLRLAGLALDANDQAEVDKYREAARTADPRIDDE